MWRIPIYNNDIPKPKRVFDVETDDNGKIRRYLTQNIKGSAFVDSIDVERQIDEFFEKRIS